MCDITLWLHLYLLNAVLITVAACNCVTRICIIINDLYLCAGMLLVLCFCVVAYIVLYFLLCSADTDAVVVGLQLLN